MDIPGIVAEPTLGPVRLDRRWGTMVVGGRSGPSGLAEG